MLWNDWPWPYLERNMVSYKMIYQQRKPSLLQNSKAHWAQSFKNTFSCDKKGLWHGPWARPLPYGNARRDTYVNICFFTGALPRLFAVLVLQPQNPTELRHLVEAAGFRQQAEVSGKRDGHLGLPVLSCGRFIWPERTFICTYSVKWRCFLAYFSFPKNGYLYSWDKRVESPFYSVKWKDCIFSILQNWIPLISHTCQLKLLCIVYWLYCWGKLHPRGCPGFQSNQSSLLPLDTPTKHRNCVGMWFVLDASKHRNGGMIWMHPKEILDNV